MGLLDKLVDNPKQNLKHKHLEEALVFENRCQENECTKGRENLRNDYPEIYNKLKTEMGESRFNDDILYNSEVRNLSKVWKKAKEYIRIFKKD